MFPNQTRILVVDDFPTMRKIMKKVLSEVGFKDIQEASDGRTAWALIKQAYEDNRPFGLIITDESAPQLEGIELLRLCRENSDFNALPFILVAGQADKFFVKEVTRLGVTDYIVKPFNAAALKSKMEKVWIMQLSQVQQKAG